MVAEIANCSGFFQGMRKRMQAREAKKARKIKKTKIKDQNSSGDERLEKNDDCKNNDCENDDCNNGDDQRYSNTNTNKNNNEPVDKNINHQADSTNGKNIIKQNGLTKKSVISVRL